MSTIGHRPLISLVVPCYNVERYIPEFIDSIERNLSDETEVIFVSDGPTDGTGEILREYVSRVARDNVKLIEQQNAGLCGARNRGMAVATGEWVSFPDPDDILDEDYLANVVEFIREGAGTDVALVVTNRVRFAGVAGRYINDLSERWKYRDGQRVVNLEEEPSYFQQEVGNSFLLLDIVRRSCIEFDSRIPAAEDLNFVARYLLAHGRPTVGLVDTARYLYRMRSSGGSLSQTAWQNPRSFDDKYRFGLIATFRLAVEFGPVPLWLQHLGVWCLAQLLKQGDEVFAQLQPAQVRVLHERVHECLSYIGDEAIAGFRNFPLSRRLIATLLAIRDPNGSVVPAAISASGPLVGTVVRLCVPVEHGGADAFEFRIDGTPVRPKVVSVRPTRYLGRNWVNEVTLRVPGRGQLHVELAGSTVTVQRGSGEPRLLAYVSPNTKTSVALRESLRLLIAYLRYDKRRLLQRGAWFVNMRFSTISRRASRKARTRVMVSGPLSDCEAEHS